MGVWIEIRETLATYFSHNVAPFVGVWIEIYLIGRWQYRKPSLPLWECGLKFHDFVPDLLASVVAPFVGVWIEICCFYFSGDPVFRRSLCGSVD